MTIKKVYPHDGGEAYLRDDNLHGEDKPVREESISDVSRKMDAERPNSSTAEKTDWLHEFLKQHPEHRTVKDKPKKEVAAPLSAKGRLALANGEKIPNGAELRRKK